MNLHTLVAQWKEQGASNACVAGSNPAERANVSSQARHEPNSGGVPSSPSLALSSNSRASSSTREDTGTAGDLLPANAVPATYSPWNVKSKGWL